MQTVHWRRLRESGSEYCEISFLPVTRFAGFVCADINGEPVFVSYVVECDTEGATRSVCISSRSKGQQQSLELYRSDEDKWYCDGEELLSFRGLTDIDLGITPSTNTLAIRRLKLSPGQSADLTAVWVQFPHLTITPLEQRYTCIDATTYLYESIKSGYKAHLLVDLDGVVMEYEQGWTR